MIVFRTEKEFSHFAVEAPRMTPRLSARCIVGVVLKVLHNVLNNCFYTCVANQIQKMLHHLYIYKVAIFRLKNRDSSI